ncbi:hypothetical protein WMO40_19160 [Bacillaceae bacterium CLA-AA-H227]|uniref:Uncharacterized protein n=1 Tax=Robertmurraya yapensis (ex Hitch et al 2024) TaxID=3133160 RepID=A0ACC6SFB8_9BACI|nr:hypothetical protein [Bacillus yapensis]
MKVNYPVKDAKDIKEIKDLLKPFGGRCAKLIDGNLEYQIKDENQENAYNLLKEKGIIQ